jgi:hypothetical protein
MCQVPCAIFKPEKRKRAVQDEQAEESPAAAPQGDPAVSNPVAFLQGVQTVLEQTVADMSLLCWSCRYA